MNIQTKVFEHFQVHNLHTAGGEIHKTRQPVLLLFMGKNLGAEETIVTFALKERMPNIYIIPY